MCVITNSQSFQIPVLSLFQIENISFHLIMRFFCVTDIKFQDLGSFTIYVDKFLAFFDHVLPSVEIFHLIKVDKKYIIRIELHQIKNDSSDLVSGVVYSQTTFTRGGG